MKEWRWRGLSTCVRCGYVGKRTNGDDKNFAGVQEIYFDSEFMAQDDAFTRFYERLNNKRRLRDLREFLPKGKTLEIGVGRGQLMLDLRKAGYEVSGLDTSKAICANLKTRFSLPVDCSSLEEYARPTIEGSYDGIIMCHVLEHIESVSLTLQAARRLLREDGILYLAVPNVSAWNARLAGWTGYEPYHLHYFQASTLRRVLESEDFAILSESTFEPLSGWFNAVTRSITHRSPNLEASLDSDRARSHKGFAWTVYNIARLATGLLTSPLRLIQSALGRGEELIIVARAKSSS